MLLFFVQLEAKGNDLLLTPAWTLACLFEDLASATVVIMDESTMQETLAAMLQSSHHRPCGKPRHKETPR